MIHERTARLLAALLLGALLVAGCGGGGGEPSVAASVHELLQQEYDEALLDLRAERAARQSAQASLLTARAALQTAEASVARLTAVIGAAADAANASTSASLHAQLNAAKAEVTRLTGELATATAKVTTLETLVGDTTNPTATSLRGQIAKLTTDLAAAQAQVTVLTGRLGTAETELEEAQEGLTTAQQQAQQARAEADQRIEDAERQGKIALRANQYITAINGGGTARTVTVNYMRGDTLKINPGGNFDAGTGAPSISGFTARTYTRQVGVSGEQTLYLYTNIQAPGERAFWKLNGLEIAAPAEDTTAKTPTPTAAAQYITDPDDSTMTTGVRVSGTYDGVSGTYTCVVTDACVGEKMRTVQGTVQGTVDLTALVTSPANGVRSFGTTGNWSFKPGNIASPVRGQNRPSEDTEHLYFGIWVNEPNVASMPHAYQYIMGGSPAYTALDTPGLPGTAKFSGGAVGKYVTRNQVGENAKIGTFTAKADFTATFGGSPTLEGRITGFRDGSQELTGWSVYLGDANNAPNSFTAGALTDGVASALIGGVSATGEWDATLHGTMNNQLGHTATDSPRDLTKYPLARYPVADLAGVVGNFHATSDTTAADANAAIAGAFAATPSR